MVQPTEVWNYLIVDYIVLDWPLCACATKKGEKDLVRSVLPRARNVCTFSRMRQRIYVKAQKWRYIVSSSTPVRILVSYYCVIVGNWAKFEQLFAVHAWCSGSIMRLLLCRQDSFSDELPVNFTPLEIFSPSAVAGCCCLCFHVLFRSLSNGGREAVLLAYRRGQITDRVKIFIGTFFNDYWLMIILLTCWRLTEGVCTILVIFNNFKRVVWEVCYDLAPPRVTTCIFLWLPGVEALG